MSRGNYLTTNVSILGVADAAKPFDVKGGGYMIDLFARMPHTWFKVGQVRMHLARCGVNVSRDHVLDSLNHLCEQMGVLEKKACGTRGRITLYHYRRKMSPVQREVALRVSKRKPLAEALGARYE